MRSACTALLVLAGALAAPAAPANEAALLLSEPGGPYAEVAEAVHRRVGAVQAFDLDELKALVAARPAVAAAIGTRACESLATASLRAPLLCVLVPRAAFEDIAVPARARGRTLSALVLDQPPTRQMALIRAGLPQRLRVGALMGPDAAVQSAGLGAAAAAQGLRFAGAPVSGAADLGEQLQRVLAESDVLLAVPDSIVFSAANVQNILRSAFERRVPMIGYSPAFARAGAVLAVYSTPAQVGEQAGDWLREALAGKPLPPTQGPRGFEIAANPHIAAALGLRLEDEKVLAERVRRLEREPRSAP
jgi:ABC-type uncharacterized transport system substrate-binding protein